LKAAHPKFICRHVALVVFPKHGKLKPMLPKMLPAFFVGMCISIGHAQTNLVQVATQARFDLIASYNVGALTNGYLLTSAGSVGRQTWIDPTNQPLSYTVSFNIAHFAWTEAAFKFAPASNGTVTLTLRGPWEMSPNGLIYRQEVLWDACSATNATISNGSFEVLSGGTPVGWTPAYGDPAVNTGPVTPVDGTNYARVWHDGPWNYTFAVTGGLPVTLLRASVFSDEFLRPDAHHERRHASTSGRAEIHAGREHGKLSRSAARTGLGVALYKQRFHQRPQPGL
jgi:hypothetical protein